MTSTWPQKVAKAAVDGTPWSEYVRRIDLPDREPPESDEAPVHVLTAPILFDGVLAPARIAKDSVTIDLGSGGTIVTMHVLAEDVQIGTDAGVIPYVPHLIGGRRVLSPVGEGWDWVPVDPEEPDGLIACSIFVAKVIVR